MPAIELRVKVIGKYGFLVVPQYQSAGAAGLDLYCAEYSRIWVKPNYNTAIRTGIAVEIPEGYCGLVRGRSGLAFTSDTLPVEGTIDSDYRGEIRVKLFNFGQFPVVVSPGDRVAQLVIVPAPKIEIVQVDRLSETERGTGGFGSTGK